MSNNSNSRDDQVRTRAYALWEQAGRPDGREREHWEQASRELEDGAGVEPEPLPDGRGNLGNPTVDQLTATDATAATMRSNSPEGMAARSGSEPEAKGRKPL